MTPAQIKAKKLMHARRRLSGEAFNVRARTAPVNANLRFQYLYSPNGSSRRRQRDLRLVATDEVRNQRSEVGNALPTV